jgi:hypothetical protein
MNLNDLPSEFATTRDALHQIAFFAIAPARYEAMGRMGLEATPGGFGTPEFDGRVARVEGDLLVHHQAGNVATQEITTIRAAAEFFGMDYQVEWFTDFHDPLGPWDPDAPLSIDRESSLVLGDWFAFGFEVLDELRARGTGDDDVTEVQLWPEHFDPATELGDQEKGQRASFGASPGDGSNPEPYLYVAAWSEIDRSQPFWNNESFNGSSLGYSALLSSGDPIDRGLEFLLEGYRVLHSG